MRDRAGIINADVVVAMASNKLSTWVACIVAVSCALIGLVKNQTKRSRTEFLRGERWFYILLKSFLSGTERYASVEQRYTSVTRPFNFDHCVTMSKFDEVKTASHH